MAPLLHITRGTTKQLVMSHYRPLVGCFELLAQWAINASYSTMLFKLGKANCKQYSRTSPSGDIRTTPTPLPCELGVPSTNSVHHDSSTFDDTIVCVHSTMKLVRAYPLIAYHG